MNDSNSVSFGATSKHVGSEVSSDPDMAGREAIAQRIATIRQEIPPTIKLVAVSKGATVDQMRAAYAAGVRDFGESRIQATIEKQAALADLPDICWHLIGQLQSNKVRKALQMFDFIHSVDSLKLCQQIDRVAAELGKSPQVFLQVKMLPDPQKSGWEVADLLIDLPAINQCNFIQINGLMAIPPLGLNDQELMYLFTSVADLQNKINQYDYPSINLKYLSMGMSQDYQLAVEAGSNIIRVGSKIFIY
jgi:PLP dependent protein